MFHRPQHPIAEARPNLVMVLRCCRREAVLHGWVVDAALSGHCVDITEARSSRGKLRGCRLCTAQWVNQATSTWRPPSPRAAS